MKRIVLLKLLVIISTNSISQFSGDFSFGSTRLKLLNKEELMTNVFNFAPGLRYQHNKYYFRITYRQLIPKNKTMVAYWKEETPSGDLYYKTSIDAKLNEWGYGMGFGMTFKEADSRTLPYVSFDVYKFRGKLEYENIASPLLYYRQDSSPLNEVKLLAQYSQLRFAAGFQFLVKDNLTIFNEASINMNISEDMYFQSFCVDLGIRYFFVKKEK